MSDPTSTPASTPSTPPAGWYADPAGGGGLRYWDGQAWTDNVQPAPAAAPAAAPPAPPAPAAAAAAAAAESPFAPTTPAAPPAPAAPTAAESPESPFAPTAAVPVAPPAPAAAEPPAAWPATEAPYAPASTPPPPAYAPAGYATAGSYAPGQVAYGAMPPGFAAPPARSIGFGEAVKRAFSRWTNYSDRATVAEYWWFQLFAIVVGIVVYIVAIVLIGTSTKATVDENGAVTSASAGAGTWIGIALILVMAIVFFLVGLPLLVRRLHDGDRSGWWYFIALIPFGSLVLLAFTIMGGTPGPNRYGPVVT